MREPPFAERAVIRGWVLTVNLNSTEPGRGWEMARRERLP